MDEQKIMRTASLGISLFALFICVSLCFLPKLETQAQHYVAKQEEQSKERREREKMWETLSALEFLDYSTQQAMATAENAGVYGDAAAASFGFSQQLRLELPEKVSAADVTIENLYMSRTVRIDIPRADENYLVEYPMVGSGEHIEQLNYDFDTDSGVLELAMEQVYELSLDNDGQYLYIDFLEPKEVYEKIVVIDAGHGEGMPGATINGIKEKDIDLAIVQELKKLFDASDDETLGVYYTRLDDSNPAFAERSGLGNEIGADLFVSIHNNSYPSDTSISGTTVLFDEEKPAEGNSSRRLANLLLETLSAEAGTKNKGLVKGNDIYVIRTSEAPAALIEVGFMTNPTELANLTSSSFQQKCARGIYDGILQAFEEGY